MSGAIPPDYPLPGMRNCFEPGAYAAHPEIESIRNALRAHGALAMMSGSGATVFGVFGTERNAKEAEQALRGRCAFLVPTRFAPCGVVREDDPDGDAHWVAPDGTT